MSSPTPMKRGLVVSAVVHAIVFVGILLLPRGPARWDRVDAIAVDLVGPLKSQPSTSSPPPQAAEPETPSPEVKEPAPPPSNEKKPEAPKPERPKKPSSRDTARRFQPLAPPSTEEQSLEERLRERLESLGDAPADEAASTDPASASPTPSGVGDGDSPTSSAEVSATDFPYAWYLNLLRTKISDAWDPPASRLVSGGANQVIVRFRLARSGAVSDVDVEVLSGAPGLDSSARRAVDRAQPFPPLPDGYEDDAVDIAVRFTVSEGKR